MTAEATHIHLQAGQEHNIINTHLPEEYEGSITGQDAQAMLAQ